MSFCRSGHQEAPVEGHRPAADEREPEREEGSVLVPRLGGRQDLGRDEARLGVVVVEQRRVVETAVVVVAVLVRVDLQLHVLESGTGRDVRHAHDVDAPARRLREDEELRVVRHHDAVAVVIGVRVTPELSDVFGRQGVHCHRATAYSTAGTEPPIMAL